MNSTVLWFYRKVSANSNKLKSVFCWLTLLIPCFLNFTPVFAAEDAPIIIYNYYPRQEITSANGVLTAGPRDADEQIISFLRQNNIQSIEDYSSWLKNNFTYEKNLAPIYKLDPREILTKRRGDCRSFAALTAEVLKVAGFDPKIMALRIPEKGHAICVFEANGYYCWFDNAALIKTSAKTLTEFIQEMNQRYNIVSLLELDEQSNQWKLLYRNS
jgi:hypothetical protein